MAAFTFAMGGLFSQQAHPSVVYQQYTYSKAPDFESFGAAVSLNAAFSAAVDGADSVIVLGGTRSQPAFDPTGPSSVLDESFADSTLAKFAGVAGFIVLRPIRASASPTA